MIYPKINHAPYVKSLCTSEFLCPDLLRELLQPDFDNRDGNNLNEKWHVLPSETPVAYVERVRKWRFSKICAVRTLQIHFGLNLEEAETTYRNSRSHWECHFARMAERSFDREDSRDSILEHIQKSNITLQNGNKMFSDDEIKAFVDAPGKWAR